MKLILIRHGETEWSAIGRHTGRTDLTLTDHGRVQAAALGPVVASILPGRGPGSFGFWSSPRTRARETAEIVFGYSPRVDDRLVEFDYGDYEGLTTIEIRQQAPGWTVWQGCPDGETVADVERRVDAFLAELPEHGDEHVIVAHAHLLRILAARAIDQPGGFARHLTLGTATVSVIDDYRDGPAIARWNAS